MESNTDVLRKHGLGHFPDLKVSDELLQTRFATNCSTTRCSGGCCRVGVFVDVAERDRILARVDVIRRHMEIDQVRDPLKWFEAAETHDSDFPSGRAAHTSLRKDACVFLDGAGRCVLHKAVVEIDGRPTNLKPFFCTAFPLTIVDGVLLLDDMCDDRAECCTPDRHGDKDVFSALPAELEHVLGHEGVNELRQLAQSER